MSILPSKHFPVNDKDDTDLMEEIIQKSSPLDCKYSYIQAPARGPRGYAGIAAGSNTSASPLSATNATTPNWTTLAETIVQQKFDLSFKDLAIIQKIKNFLSSESTKNNTSLDSLLIDLLNLEIKKYNKSITSNKGIKDSSNNSSGVFFKAGQLNILIKLKEQLQKLLIE